jgi:asparagine synthase (glutamine-hydrolysing)
VPFYFFLDAGTAIISDDLSAVTQSGSVPRSVCREAVAFYLRDGELRDSRLTFFEQIQKLPRASAMTIEDSHIREWIYWRPEECPRVFLPTLKDYADRLHQLLLEAVACRTPTHGDLAVHLSGGLDSSAIAALAAMQATKAGHSVTGYSWLASPQNTSEARDPEWATGIAVANRYGIDLHYSEFNSETMLSLLESLNIAAGDTADCWYEFAVREAVIANAGAVVLSGWGGDELITHYGNQRYAETLLAGKLLPTLRDLWHATSENDRRFRRFFSSAIRELLLPFMPLRFVSRQVLPDYLGAASAALVDCARALPVATNKHPRFSVRKSQLAFWEAGHVVNRLESWAASGRQVGVEYRYPLLDKRIVEFALGLPAEMFRRKGHPRYLFRHVVRDFLPQEVWASVHKDEPVRITKAIQICVDALSRWHADHPAGDWDSPFIDSAKLNILLDKIARRETLAPEELVVDMTTAIRSILVLNMSMDLN